MPVVLITGGARSGKSTYAEKLFLDRGQKTLYIATSIPFDDEMKERVRIHQERRGLNFETLESFRFEKDSLKKYLPGKSGILVDCVTLMITNIMMDLCDDFEKLDNELIEKIETEVLTNVKVILEMLHLAQDDFLIVFVTNEVGSGIVPEHKSGRVFRDIAGRINGYLASQSDQVYLCVSGIPVKIKG